MTAEEQISQTPVAWPEGSRSWFVCRAAGRVEDIMLPIRAGAVASEAELAKRGRIKAARAFKRIVGLHPSTKVECEFQAVETAEHRAAFDREA